MGPKPKDTFAKSQRDRSADGATSSGGLYLNSSSASPTNNLLQTLQYSGTGGLNVSDTIQSGDALDSFLNPNPSLSNQQQLAIQRIGIQQQASFNSHARADTSGLVRGQHQAMITTQGPYQNISSVNNGISTSFGINSSGAARIAPGSSCGTGGVNNNGAIKSSQYANPLKHHQLMQLSS